MNITVTLPSGEKQMANFTQSKVTIGRGKKADFIVIDESLSRIHCQIELINSEFFITDLGSSNGVYLDGKKILPNVKTPFTTFLSLTLGQMECQVSDSFKGELTYEEFLQNRPDPSESSNLYTRPTRKINRDAFNGPTPTPKAPVPSGNKTFPLVVAIALLGFGFAAYLQFSGEAPSTTDDFQPSPTVETIAPVPEQKKPLEPDSFLTAKEYNQLKSQSNCSNLQKQCQELKINEASGEGLLVDGNALYIFENTEQRSIDSTFSNIKQNPDRDLIVLLYQLFKSSIIHAYQSEQISQIHLIVVNSNSEITKVYLLHQKSFNFKNTSINGVSVSVDQAIANNESTDWNNLKNEIPVKKITP